MSNGGTISEVRGMLERLGGSGALGDFEGIVASLVEYDRKNRSDLVRTLRVFFESNANASEASQRLYLHRNSMSYRLERVQNITGLDLGRSETRLALQLGLLSLASREGDGE